MKKYHKIENVFTRDMNGTKKLIEGSFTSETVEFLKDNNWYFTEKIDGTNIRVHWDGHTVTFGGRTDNAQIPEHLMNQLMCHFGYNESEEIFERLFGEKEVTLFGEGYGPKIQKVGHLYRSNPDFILFDVMVGDVYLARENVVNIAKSFGVDVVPVVLVGTIDEAVKFVKSMPDSTFGQAKMEGVVGRPVIEMLDRCGNRVITKIKVCDFE